MQITSETRRHIALALSMAVFFVFAGATLFIAMPADMHGCGQAPCTTAQTSADYCIVHCLNAAQANHGMAPAVFALAFAAAAMLAACWPLASTDEFFRMFAGAGGAFPPLRALQTVVLRE